MKNTKIFLIAALLGSVLAGCQTEIDIEPVEQSSDKTVLTLTVNATMAPATKALDLNGNELKAYWKNTEIVALYTSDSSEPELLDVTPDSGDKPTDASLTGEVAGISKGDKLLLLIPCLDSYKTCNYTGQKGTIADIEANYDFAAATVTANAPSGSTITTTTAAFENLQSIYRLGFRVGSKTGDVLNVKGITVSSANNTLISSTTVSWNSVNEEYEWADTPGTITVNLDGISNVVYASLRNTTKDMETPADDTYSFDVVDEEDVLYVGTKVIPVKNALDAQGRFLSAQKIVVNKKTIAQQSSSITTGVL